MGRACAAAEHGGQTAHQRIFNLLRTDIVNVAVKAACCEDLAFAGNRLRAGADDNVDARLRVRIARFADSFNAAVFKTHIGLVDTGVINDQRVGDDSIHRALGPCDL